MQKHKYQEAFKRFPPSNSYQSPSSSQYPQITTMSPSTQPPIHQSINCCCPIQVNAQENGKNSIDIVRNSSQFLRILPFQQKKKKDENVSRNAQDIIANRHNSLKSTNLCSQLKSMCGKNVARNALVQFAGSFLSWCSAKAQLNKCLGIFIFFVWFYAVVWKRVGYWMYFM